MSWWPLFLHGSPTLCCLTSGSLTQKTKTTKQKDSKGTEELPVAEANFCSKSLSDPSLFLRSCPDPTDLCKAADGAPKLPVLLSEPTTLHRADVYPFYSSPDCKEGRVPVYLVLHCILVEGHDK